MTTAVFAIQNDFALRYGPACTSPTSFLALRLKGLQKNQPELVSAYASSSAGSSSSFSPIHQLPSSYPTKLSSSHSASNHTANNNKNKNNNNQNNFYSHNNQHHHPLRSSVAASSIHPPQSSSSSYLMDQSSSSSSYLHRIHEAEEERERHEWNRLAQQQQGRLALNGGNTVNNMRATRSIAGYNQQQHFSSRHSSPDAVNTRDGGGRNNTPSTNNNNNTNNDIDSQPLPAPGALSSTTTLAKALSTDPEAHVPPEAITMEECYICNRRFDVTRLKRHITACQKSAAAAAKRKEFDAQEVRVKKLYENDPLAAAKVLKQIEKEEELAATGRAPPKKSTWRKKSAELNNAVGRGAAGGGPNPIPVVDDRVPCPSCGKKFSEETAARHIKRSVTDV